MKKKIERGNCINKFQERNTLEINKSVTAKKV